jgi:hypothetical protein
VDHVDPSTKVNHVIWSWSENRRLAELAKCQVLCHDCHVKKTIAQSLPQSVHGKLHMYRKHGCRCNECIKAYEVDKAAKRLWMMELRKRRKSSIGV